MTHEFKTPISTIKVSAEVFAAHPIIQHDERLSKYVNIIKEQNNRLNNQVEKVLQITKIDKRNLQLHSEIINLQELIEAILPGIQVKVEELKGTLNLQLYSKNPIIKADTLHLTNILHNLLDNAIKYCNGVPDLCVSTLDRNQQIMLIIEDKGIGIDKEFQKRVFDRFYRVPTGDIHNVKGFGLGLYYVRNICKAQGWELSLNSELGKGTKIAITMPREL
jgi:two-component system, OmpR family, phosphate regulon sensor histidine kinase PhoR